MIKKVDGCSLGSNVPLNTWYITVANLNIKILHEKLQKLIIAEISELLIQYQLIKSHGFLECTNQASQI
jgi:hypothetical protein